MAYNIKYIIYSGYKILLALLIIPMLLITNSCKKNHPPEPQKEKCNCAYDKDCYTFDRANQPTTGWQHRYDSAFNIMPCFNPVNADEILFVRKSIFTQQIVKYNLTSKNQMVLYIGRVSYPPKWSSTGWILFAGVNDQIWKLKDDGTQLTQLTFKDKNYYPEWAPDGKQFCYGKIIDTIIDGKFTAYGSGVIADENGNTLHILDHSYTAFAPYSSWGESNQIITAPTTSDISVYEPDSREFKKISWNFCSESSGVSSPICWIDSQTIVWAEPKTGLIMSNINTNTHTCIAKNCDSKGYHNLSYSKQLNKIITDGGISTPDYAKGEITIKHFFCIMNTDGSNKQTIEIQ